MNEKPEVGVEVELLDGASALEAVDRAFDHEIMVVGPGIKTGMPVLYENPREVGADRIVNAVAAYERVKGAAVVVDFGTATTFDCVSRAGELMRMPAIRIGANATVKDALAMMMEKGISSVFVDPPATGGDLGDGDDGHVGRRQHLGFLRVQAYSGSGLRSWLCCSGRRRFRRRCWSHHHRYGHQKRHRTCR